MWNCLEIFILYSPAFEIVEPYTYKLLFPEDDKYRLRLCTFF